MPTAENGKLEYEAGQDAYPMGALTDSGDQITFTSMAELWSARSGSTAKVYPDGLATGGLVTVGSGNNAVNIAALTVYLAGVKTSVSASAGESITRAATDVASITSITIDNAGAVAAIKGADSATSAFSETRGAAGGPPYIAAGSVEIAQVRTTSNVAGVIASTEIFQVDGLHQERWDSPLWTEENENGQVVFNSALPVIHTGDTAKGVNASYAEPILTTISLADDFKPAETSHSVSSKQVYGNTIGSTSETLGQGAFNAYVNDGITDGIVKEKNQNLWFRFYPDKYKAAHLLTQGKLGVTRSFPSGDNLVAACTISAQTASIEVE